MQHISRAHHFWYQVCIVPQRMVHILVNPSLYQILLSHKTWMFKSLDKFVFQIVCKHFHLLSRTVQKFVSFWECSQGWVSCCLDLGKYPGWPSGNVFTISMSWLHQRAQPLNTNGSFVFEIPIWSKEFSFILHATTSPYSQSSNTARTLL